MSDDKTPTPEQIAEEIINKCTSRELKLPDHDMYTHIAQAIREAESRGEQRVLDRLRKEFFDDLKAQLNAMAISIEERVVSLPTRLKGEQGWMKKLR